MRESQFPYDLPGGLPGEEVDDLEMLETLVRDLRRYASGRLPSPADMASAPLVSDWHVVLDPSSFRLAGVVSAHPRVGPGPGMTSRVYAIDPGLRWVRTYSRLWRLGSSVPRPGRRHDA